MDLLNEFSNNPKTLILLGTIIYFLMFINELIITTHSNYTIMKSFSPIRNWKMVHETSVFVMKYVGGFIKIVGYACICIGFVINALKLYDSILEYTVYLSPVLILVAVSILDIFINEKTLQGFKIFSKMEKKSIYITKKVLALIYLLGFYFLMLFLIPEVILY